LREIVDIHECLNLARKSSFSRGGARQALFSASGRVIVPAGDAGAPRDHLPGSVTSCQQVNAVSIFSREVR